MLLAAGAAFWFTRTPIPEPLWVGPEGYDWAERRTKSEMVELRLPARTSKSETLLRTVDPETGRTVSERKTRPSNWGPLPHHPHLRAYLTLGRENESHGFVEITEDATDKTVACIPLLWPPKDVHGRGWCVSPFSKIVQRNREDWLCPIDRIRVFDPETGTLEHDLFFKLPLGHRGGIMEASPDGRWLAVSSYLRNAADITFTTRLIDLRTGQLDHELDGLNLFGQGPSWSADSRHLACWGRGKDNENLFVVVAGPEWRVESSLYLYRRPRVGEETRHFLDPIDWYHESGRVILKEGWVPWQWPTWIPNWAREVLAPLKSSNVQHVLWLHSLKNQDRWLVAANAKGLSDARMTSDGRHLLVRSHDKEVVISCYALPGHYIWPTGWRVAVILSAAVLAGLVSWRLLQERRASARRVDCEAPQVPSAA